MITSSPRKGALLLSVAVVGLIWPAGGRSTAFASRVTVGGIYEATDLINAANSTQFRSFANTGLYIHNGGTIAGVQYGWLSLTPTQKTQMIDVWGANGPQTLELGWEADGVGWQNAYAANYLPEGVQAGEINANISTTDANGHASDTDAFATIPASDISGWTVYVDGFRNLSTGAVNGVYPVYAPNLKGKDANGNAVDAWLMGGTGSNPFASGSFFADVRAMASYGGGIAVDTPPQQFFHNIPAGADGNGQAEYQAIAMGEVAWANSQHLHSTWIVSPNTAGANYNTVTQQMVRALETNATGSRQYIPTEYAVENYGTTASIETNNPIGTETAANNELGVALWLAGYEQGRNGDLQMTPAGAGLTHLTVTNQTATSLGGKNTTIALPAAGQQPSSYTITLQNTSSNSSNWYIPTLKATTSGDSADWSLQILLNGQDITAPMLSDDGFTFNATAITNTAGLVMNNGSEATLTFNFDPLTADAASDPYALELIGLAHPDASDAFASVAFVADVPEPSAMCALGALVLLRLFGVRQRRRLNF